MLCLVLWQSVVLAKENARPGFGHFGGVKETGVLWKESACYLLLPADFSMQ